MKRSTCNTTRITEKEHWIYIDNHLPTDIQFVKTVQNAKNLHQIRKEFQIQAVGIYPNYTLIVERWQKRIKNGNQKLQARLNRENIDLGWNIDESPIFKF